MHPLERIRALHPQWSSPGGEPANSLPVGNGTVGANLWTTGNGGLGIYMARTDAWDDLGRLIKLGRLHVRPVGLSTPTDTPHHEELSVVDATFHARHGGFDYTAWVDAFSPALHIEIRRPPDTPVEVVLDDWRPPGAGPLNPADWHKTDLKWADDPADTGDTCLEPAPGTLFLHRRNRAATVWRKTLEAQWGSDLADPARDPLARKSMGLAVHGPGGRAVSPALLRFESGVECIRIIILAPAPVDAETADWRGQCAEQLGAVLAVPFERRRADHNRNWENLWDRSWIFIDGEGWEPGAVTRAYLLQRYMNLIGGRGPFPVKFNGSIFTADFSLPGFPEHADFRQWGGAYWFQNTRLTYWSMPAAGDTDLMPPLFDTYLAALPLREAHSRRHFGHEGAYFPETMYFWGAFLMSDYDRNRDTLPPGVNGNPYTRHYWCAGLELAALLQAHIDHSGETERIETQLLPLLRAHALFYLGHFTRSADGTLVVDPAQALEQFHDVRDPLPDIAGWEAVLAWCEKRGTWSAAADRDLFGELRSALPPLPTGRDHEGTYFRAAAEIRDTPQNTENPELYSIFPYKLHGVGLPGLDTVRRTFLRRITQDCGGWRQDPIQAARLGWGPMAASMLTRMANANAPGTRFPAFWGPNFDWVPDQDHGAVLMTALQQMLLQEAEGELIAFPAWPEHWKVSFRLHGSGGAIVEGCFDGETREARDTTTGRSVRIHPEADG